MNKSTARLAWPLAISLALHLGVGWLFSPGSAENRLRQAKAVTLTVTLASKDRSDPLRVSSAEPAVADSATAALPAVGEAGGILTQKARFLVAPNLAALEAIPVQFAGSLTLRLHVTALGTVDRITVIKGDPVPKELLDGLLTRFEHARLAPALAGSEAVASTLDLVIRYEPGPTLLPRDQ
ncbi:MAG: energy transducer TonB [Sulfuritalea sp.]|nr:energy transducer TonB [Sulfuritalea sp.]